MYNFLGAHPSFLGTGLGRGQGRFTTSRLARTVDEETRENVRRHDLYRSHASMNKQKKKTGNAPISGNSHSDYPLPVNSDMCTFPAHFIPLCIVLIPGSN